VGSRSVKFLTTDRLAETNRDLIEESVTSLNIAGNTISFEELEKTLFDYGVECRWDSKLAKWGSKGEQSILAHAINTYSIAKKLCMQLKDDLGLSDWSILISLVAAFVHDSGKETDEYQRSIWSGKAIDHCPIDDNEIRNLEGMVRSIMGLLKIDLTDDEQFQLEFGKIFSAVTEHMKGEYDLARAINVLGQHFERDNRIVSIVRIADTIASWKTLDDVRYDLPLVSGRMWISFHKVVRIRGILTSILHEAIEQLVRERGSDLLLSYPDGSLYIGRLNPFASINRNDLAKLIEKKIDSILNSPDVIARLILGRPGRTVLNAPELIRKDNVKAVLQIANQRPFRSAGKRAREYILRRSNLVKEKDQESVDKIWEPTDQKFFEDYRKKNFPAMTSSSELSKDIEEAESGLLIQAARDAFILSVFNEIRNTSKAQSQVKDEFINLLDDGLWSKLDYLGANDPVKCRLRAVDYFWALPATKLDKSASRGTIGQLSPEQRRNLLVGRLSEILEKSLIPSSGNNVISDVAKNLVKDDLIVPNFKPVDTAADENNTMRDFYNVSKIEKDLGLCCICGAPGTIHPAIADLIGDGAESFTNKLPAGVNLGGKNKSKICILCKYEAILRAALGVKASKEVILLMPQVNLSRELYSRLAEAYDQLSKFQLEGHIPLLSYDSLADYAATNQLSVCKVSYLIPKSKSETLLKRIFTILEEEVSEERSEIGEYIRKLGLTVPPDASSEYIADALLQNLSLVKSKDPILFGNISTATQSNMSIVFQTPNFAAIFRRKEIKLTKRKGSTESSESDSSAALRKMLVGLAFSKIMLCSVIFLSGLNILENFTPKGTVRIPEILNAKRIAEEWTGRQSEWISLVHRDALLRRLGACFVVAKYAFPKLLDSAFRCSRLSQGELLHRLETKKVGVCRQAELLKHLLVLGKV
jgi:arsenate reductase-like glutaredoxin family protein